MPFGVHALTWMAVRNSSMLILIPGTNRHAPRTHEQEDEDTKNVILNSI